MSEGANGNGEGPPGDMGGYTECGVVAVDGDGKGYSNGGACDVAYGVPISVVVVERLTDGRPGMRRSCLCE